MRRFVLIVISISFCFFIAFISFEFFLRAIPNDFTEKNYYFNQNKHEIEVLILGSSHSYVGIDPKQFQQKAFSYAYSSQTLDLDAKIFNQVKNQLPQLKTVIIPISYFSYVLALEDGTLNHKIKNYNIYYSIFSHTYYFKNSAEVLHQSFNKNWTLLNRFLQSPRFQISVDSTGFIEKRYLNNKMNWKEKVDHSINNHSKPMANSVTKLRIKQNKQALENIINWCSDRKIQVILVSTPTISEYFRRLNPDQFLHFKNTTQRISEQYKNVTWLNYLENSSKFSREDFQDPDHLNLVGAQKLTLKINTVLVQSKN